MPLYCGELLETRLSRPGVGLEEGRNIAVKLGPRGSGAASRGIIHRDIKRNNVILEGGSLKLIDLGVVRVPGLEMLLPDEIPGTQPCMAPEMFEGERGNEATDIYALGVSMYRVFTCGYPVPQFRRCQSAAPQSAERLFLGAAGSARLALGRTSACDRDRSRASLSDTTEFAFEIEAGPACASTGIRRPHTLYERAPLQIRQRVAALLPLALLVSLLVR